jgi:hypothetical protein
VKDLEDLDIFVLDTMTGEVLGASEDRCITIHVDIDAIFCISHSNKTIASFNAQGSGSSMHLQSFPLPGPAATVSAPSSSRSSSWLNHSHEGKKQYLWDVSTSYSPDDKFILLFCWHEGERTTDAPTVTVEAISISTNTSTSHTLPCDLLYGGDFSKTGFNSGFHFPGNKDTWLVAYALSSHPILRVSDVMTGSLVGVIRSKPSLLFNPGLKNYQWATGLLYDGKVWRHVTAEESDEPATYVTSTVIPCLRSGQDDYATNLGSTTKFKFACTGVMYSEGGSVWLGETPDRTTAMVWKTP